MKRREFIKRGLAALITFGFMAIVRPNETSLIGIAFIVLLLNEGLYWSIDYIWRMKRHSDRYKKMIRMLQVQREMRKVELQRFRRRVS